ncbi:uncharacterized protein LOC131601445 [Vicia villosa]|uniref:uncharacterized protein LOC131601445 n=1 Tax=Vicia villosa TaxID=3911 RepID=UPI00273CA29D|nr:uncharacterized protein LOC131601445 [Vicia villosa]
MPLLSLRHFIPTTTLTSSFHSHLFLNRCFLLRFSSNKISLPMAETSNDTANSSSPPESQPRSGDMDANDKKKPKSSLLEFISSCNHLPSPTTSTDYEQSKFKRRNRVDLEMGQRNRNNYSESSFRSSFEDNSNISPTKTLSVTKKFKSHHNDSPHRSHFLKTGDTASADRRYNKRQRKFNYDICSRGKRKSTLTGATPLEENKENCIEFEMQEEGTNEGILRPGMVLLKHHLTHHEQVEIVKSCRDLGLGPGGFYQPGYADGAKLRLMMMCLGMDWDPQTRNYGYKRVIDGSKPPSIPPHFSKLVTRAIQEARQLCNRECGITYVEDILPSMTPDICIVNFYSTTGRLGLHQDRDESVESLQKGLPVVSFSIGDSAEFLYGDQRDAEKAENVLLESGDVLIFGGDSRHVYHGVSSIIPNSTPEELVQDTGLCPGRLNLTFRQY